VERSCEHGNEPSGPIELWEVLEWLQPAASREGSHEVS
jgi:predicted deacylase